MKLISGITFQLRKQKLFFFWVAAYNVLNSYKKMRWAALADIKWSSRLFQAALWLNKLNKLIVTHI